MTRPPEFPYTQVPTADLLVIKHLLDRNHEVWVEASGLAERVNAELAEFRNPAEQEQARAELAALAQQALTAAQVRSITQQAVTRNTAWLDLERVVLCKADPSDAGAVLLRLDPAADWVACRDLLVERGYAVEVIDPVGTRMRVKAGEAG
ncbi:hypothetical protein ACU635_43580 [[Actinomadura] parvosata]|uniref:hypothetical protein n=1 Tax=[Actinomadura] parvosata TaxID=1955412 RepID=UPI00406C1E90